VISIPDLSMCNNLSCPKYSDCYRAMCIADSWQSYIEFKNICGEWNGFQYLYPIGDKPIRKEELPK
jgi:hypothetical protein